MALSPQWLDELRARVTLSTVIMRTVKLQRAGREWKACCPFHDEKTPSFYVNDAKGFYHCFGCQAHGDVIRWMTDQRGLPFMDAVKELASEAGMELPAPDPQAARAAERRATLHDVTAAAQGWFVDNLRGADGARARDYLARRGFSDATVREFGFGYAPDSRQALARALARIEEPQLVESGMRIAPEDHGTDKPPYDRFRDRLMLPIQDMRGRVIAFGGRTLSDDAYGPKYLNSPDTPLFDKGRTLYNLHRAAPASRRSGRVVVVEGYMDAIALADAGIGDAVAPLGTALTEHQIELLWRLVERPVLCLDGDAAGQRAAMKAIARALPLLRPAHTLAIVRLPDGLDPDDLIRQRGVGAMEGLLAEPASLLDTLWAFERDAQPLATPEAKAGLKQRLIDHVETIAHPDIKALYKRELLERFSAFAFPPRQRGGAQNGGFGGGFGANRGHSGGGRGKWQPGGRPPPAPVPSQMLEALRRSAAGGSRDGLLAAVIAGLLQFPDQLARHGDALADLAERDRKAAPAIEPLLEIAEALEESDELPISCSTGPVPHADKKRFAFLMEGFDPDDARQDLAEAVALLVERPALEAALAAATARFDTDPQGAFAEQQRLLKRKLEFESRLGQITGRKAARAAARHETSTASPDAGTQETD